MFSKERLFMAFQKNIVIYEANYPTLSLGIYQSFRFNVFPGNQIDHGFGESLYF